MELFCFLAAPCGILAPRLGIKPVLPALGTQSRNPWTARKVPIMWNLKNHINELFILCFINIHWCSLHVEWIFYPCMVFSIRCCSFGIYWFTELHRSAKCWCISLYNAKKFTFIDTTADLIRRAFTFGKLFYS